jgi:adenylate cyclase
VNSFFTELRRRKVYRVAVSYGVVAWFLIQFSAVTLPAWGLPILALRCVIVLVLIGFPFALLFGWVFEFTPTGLHHTVEIMPPNEAGRTKSRARKWLLLLAAVGLCVSLGAGVLILPRAAIRKVEKSIAVLPF